MAENKDTIGHQLPGIDTTELWMPPLLIALAQNGGNLGAACKTANITRQTVRKHLKLDEEFAEAFTSAQALGLDALEDEATRRAFEGFEEPVFQGGQYVGSKRRYSDELLKFMLRGGRPKKFRERLDHHHSGDVKMGVLEMIQQANQPVEGEGDDVSNNQKRDEQSGSELPSPDVERSGQMDS